MINYMYSLTPADFYFVSLVVKIINQGPVVQSIVSLMSSLKTNSLTLGAKVFSNTLIFLLQKATHILSAKISKYLLYFEIEVSRHIS